MVTYFKVYTEAQIIARTSLRHKIINWQQTIDLMLWPFAHKATAERLNSLTVNLHSSTHESIFIVFQSNIFQLSHFTNYLWFVL
jgi:hypothetical protein